MAKKSAPSAITERESHPLAEAIDRLSTEISALRQVIDEVREDFSWLTRNGLPVQPIEHIHVKRMALDPRADDWNERLEIERSTFIPRGGASPLETDVIDQVVEELKATLEFVAQGQLEMVLTGLDAVREEILKALHRRIDPAGDGKSDSPLPDSPSPAPTSSSPSTSSPPSSSPSPRPPPGRLF